MAKKITQVTVREMCAALVKAVQEGYGNRYLVCSDDNEGNGYHGCFFHLTPMDAQFMDMVSDSQIMIPEQLMIIG